MPVEGEARESSGATEADIGEDEVMWQNPRLLNAWCEL
jgi:hypothetical protein